METQKKFRCKNEELIVMCEYVQVALQRDLADFNAYSPKFNQILANFKSKIASMRQVIFPQEKTQELKILTIRLYDTMDKVLDLQLRLAGYLKLAKKDVPISATDFGIVPLKQKIRTRDAEGVLHYLLQVNANIEKYKKQLVAQGLAEELITQLKKAFDQINEDNKKQFEIVSSRRLLTAENTNALNALYEQMMEICTIGKVIYRKLKP
ncbi:MAG: hypothetical protein LBR55_03505, partial [Bacteroidales bacterium]|nr:hypothetical protein [Bacteroidales bacterium]